jgi:hypothetical protein
MRSGERLAVHGAKCKSLRSILRLPIWLLQNLVLTEYDNQHLITYLRLLDADSEGADWRDVARVVLKIDPNNQPQRARRAWESHLSRAKWMTTSGFEHLLRGGAPH